MLDFAKGVGVIAINDDVSSMVVDGALYTAAHSAVDMSGAQRYISLESPNFVAENGEKRQFATGDRRLGPPVRARRLSVMWWISVMSCVIATAFTFVLVRQFKERRRMHQLFWSIGLAMFTVATFGEFYGAAFEWTVPVYKLYYFSGVALPGFFGVGTVYLMTRNRPVVGHVYAGVVTVIALLFLVAVAQVELNTAAMASSGIAPSHADIMPDQARRPYSVLLSAVGGLVLVAGALYSWLRHGLTYNRFIFVGGLFFVTGGMFASRLGINELLPVTNLIGIIFIFIGVQQAAAVRRRPAATIS